MRRRDDATTRRRDDAFAFLWDGILLYSRRCAAPSLRFDHREADIARERFLHLSVAGLSFLLRVLHGARAGFPVLLSPGIVRARLQAQAPLADAEH
jgi:hypothetical protein